MIEVRNLSKYYGAHRAVDNISFTVADGEIVGFLGPNGAGKTTTIRILTCFQPATSGSATVAGHDVFTESLAVRAAVGYMPENVPLYPEMRVREYLRFRGKLRGLDGAAREAAIDRVTQRCWLQDVINRPISQLSKGFRQRVGLADALLHNPPVLILDEPTVGLDPTQIRETRSLIRELAQDHTVILSSHILPEVEATCQRIIIIHKGKLVASGSPSELRERISEGAKVIAEIKGAPDEIGAAVRQLPGVTDVQAERRDGWTRLAVVAASDLRETIAQTAFTRGWAVRELHRDAASLEDFFVKIVTGAHEQE
ncbi:MAG: ABC transporter ATP-binding protein [Phycisphaerae bacterium]|nr:ABC transporter ATP-binding protein [Phycisphaerae bacterium]HRS29298.1 ABC transporter ATP-binding protein [Phycisphaerae bacterium]HRT42401.1 ABC transporter ATP-binding protein [Phycisphaerae bacterium]